MSLNETALACLNRNRLLYLNMLEVLRRGSAELLYAGEGGVLLYDRGSGAYMLTARDRATLDGMLPLLPADCDLLVGHDLWYRDELGRPLRPVEGGAVRPGRLDGSGAAGGAGLRRGAAPFGGGVGPLRL